MSYVSSTAGSRRKFDVGLTGVVMRYYFAAFFCHSDMDRGVILPPSLTLYDHIKTAQQRTIIQRYSDWNTGRLWVGCYIWYREEGTGRGRSPPSPLLDVANQSIKTF